MRNSSKKRPLLISHLPTIQEVADLSAARVRLAKVAPLKMALTVAVVGDMAIALLRRLRD
jgi:hypothetical protein